MKRVTITLDEELQEYVDEKSEEYGDRSKVIREALHRMKKHETIDDIRNYFRNKHTTQNDDEDESNPWSDLEERS